MQQLYVNTVTTRTTLVALIILRNGELCEQLFFATERIIIDFKTEMIIKRC